VYIYDVSKVIRYCRLDIYGFAACAVNDLKLNPMKSQVLLISRCRVNIPPPTLLIGSDVIKVVPKAYNLGFVLNKVTDHFKKVRQKVYWILHSLRPHASHAPFEVRRRFIVSMSCLTLDMGYCVCWWGCCITTEVEYGLFSVHSFSEDV
jgi:hypothetical protein